MTLEGDGRKLPVKTIYRHGREVVKTNSAGSGFTAVPRAVMHMRANDYEASVVEVFNEQNGKLHAVMKLDVHGHLHVLYQRPYKEGE